MAQTFKRLFALSLIAAATLAAADADADAGRGLVFLYSFCAKGDWPCSDGDTPGSVIADSSGNLYGTTLFGGNDVENVCGTAGCGTVFKVSSKGVETVLYAFCQKSGCTDGHGPSRMPLIRDAKGNLYGASPGGAYDYGMVFKLTADGIETVLYSFSASQPGPTSGVIMDVAGNFYGTNDGLAHGECGSAFRLDSKGKYTDLHDFGQSGDACVPAGGLFEDKNGNLYGTTEQGGTANKGAVFKIGSDGSYGVLYSFCSQSNCTDGETPESSLIQDAAGNLYGTTWQGGAGGFGTAYKLAGSGKETVLHAFCNCGDGGDPVAPLLEVGNLFYGTTQIGESYGGVIFKLSGRKETAIYRFSGNGIVAPVIKLKDWIYGTTYSGGVYGSGAVFKLGNPTKRLSRYPGTRYPGT